jgi:ribosome maturation factor RimP
MHDSTAPVDLPSKVRATADQILEGSEAYVVSVEVRGHKGSRVVYVYVDTDAGISIDRIAQISRELGFALEEEDVIDGKYTLDVSSPGATKPLLLPRQYPRHIGRPMAVKYREGDETAKVEGELVAVGDDGFTLQPGGGAEALVVSFDRLIEAKIKLPW